MMDAALHLRSYNSIHLAAGIPKEGEILFIPILIAVAAVLIGGVIGFALRRNREAPLRTQVRDLEAQIDKLNSEHTAYRSQVGQHFSETGDPLKNMALHLCDTYEHLAGGANELCPDEIKTLRPGHAAEELLLAEPAEPLEASIGEPLEAEQDDTPSPVIDNDLPEDAETPSADSNEQPPPLP